MTAKVTTLILCQGSAERLWPLSREDAPLELSVLAGHKTSLLAQAIEHAPAGNVIIATTAGLAPLVEQHLADNPGRKPREHRTLVETWPRGSALTLALVATEIRQHDPDAIILTLPATLGFKADDRWKQTLKRLIKAAQAGYVTVAGTPKRNASKTGCIKPGVALRDLDGVHQLRNYVAEPSASYVYRASQQQSLWDTGIMAASASEILVRLKGAGDTEGVARIAETARFIVQLGRGHLSNIEAKGVLETLPKLDFARAVFAGCSDLAVVPTSIEFQRYDTLRDIIASMPRNAAGNSVQGSVTLDEAKETAVLSTSNQTIKVVGTNNLAIIETPQGLLITSKDHL
jgi:mannose-1-phosphate guanylyltransferase